MRIAYISGAYVPSRGANSMHAMRMCQAIARQGHEATLHVRPGDFDTQDDFQFYGVAPCFRIVKTSRPQVRVWGALVNAWRTRKLINSGPRPDLIYAREFWALYLLLGCGVPFIFESHWKPKSRIHRLVEAAILRHENCRRIVLISDALRKVYSEEFPWLSPERVLISHDGADPATGSVVPRPISIREGALQVGYVGSFWPGYGIAFIEDLASEVPEADFHIIGGEIEEVDSRGSRGLDAANLRYHGFVAPAVLPEYFAALDVALAPYQANTPHIRWISPMKLFEYMAHGKAIICSDFPVIREIIRNDEEGLLVPAADLDAWVCAIHELADPARRQRIGQKARARLEREFTWDHRARRVLEGV